MRPDPAAEIEDKLACARSYSSPDITEPNWDRAKACVDRILELEPIHDEANKLAKKIEQDLTYPGQIRVTVIREMRAVEYAK